MNKSDLTTLQIQILEFTKSTYFHSSLNDFLKAEIRITQDEAIEALKSLRSKRIVSMGPSATSGPDLMNGWIEVTNYGWKIMGWED